VIPSSARAINGPIEDLLFPIHHGILYYPGVEVLPPFVLYGTDKMTPGDFEDAAKAWKERLLSLETAGDDDPSPGGSPTSPAVRLPLGPWRSSSPDGRGGPAGGAARTGQDSRSGGGRVAASVGRVRRRRTGTPGAAIDRADRDDHGVRRRGGTRAENPTYCPKLVGQRGVAPGVSRAGPA
jgi:hypothetical protein